MVSWLKLSLVVCFVGLLAALREDTPFLPSQVSLRCSVVPRFFAPYQGRWQSTKTFARASSSKTWAFVSVYDVKRDFFQVQCNFASSYVTASFGYVIKDGAVVQRVNHQRLPLLGRPTFDIRERHDGAITVQSPAPFFSGTIEPAANLWLRYPLSQRRSSFVRKVAGASVAGAPDAWAAVDITSSSANRHTRWKWIQASGRLRRTNQTAVTFGINLSQHVYDCHEQGRPCGAENVLFVNGTRVLPIPGPIDIRVPATNLTAQPWHIHTERARLTAYPLAVGFEDHTNVPFLLRNNFQQVVGRLEGTVQLDDDAWWTIDTAIGVMEDHDALW